MNANQSEALLAYHRSLLEATPDEYTQGTIDGMLDTLNLLGIKLEGVNVAPKEANA